MEINVNKDHSTLRRLKRLKKGWVMLKAGGILAVILTVAVIIMWLCTGAELAVKILLTVAALLTVIILLFLGTVNASVASRQVKLIDRVLLLTLWWLPPLNIILLRRLYKTAKREYIVESDRIELENARASNEICKTKYPVILVHGIFFRDWQIMNYWGRIPASLIRNGTVVYYGGQQSSRSVADSAQELRQTILRVLAETGADKVNIIAHSKGGLDSRYAISKLGMYEHVATLTTINTPHKGCDMVDFLLEKLPDSFAQFIAGIYNSIFSKLGDTAPDFMAGVRDLSAVRARSYDAEMPDSPLVSYRSFMSVMTSPRSAGFPLNIGFRLINRLNGANDGLVWEESARHGSYTLINSPKKRGISHGDVIDLLRENIEGFDVREFYIDIVRSLKSEGY